MYNQISNHNFQLCLLTTDNQLLHTVFMCKDYFQDMFWCEHNNVEGEVYGLTWKPGMLDKDAKTFRIALFGGGIELEYKAELIQKFINFFDDAQGFMPTTISLTDNTQVIIVEFDGQWTKSGPLLSSLTTLMRISGAYQGEEPIAYLKSLLDIVKKGNNVSPLYSNTDAYRLPTILPKLNALLKGMKVTLPWSAIQSAGYAHGTGIVGWKDYPTVPVE
jgi:hypothetical protein